MESRSPELPPYPSFEAGECERGWLGFPMIWIGPGEGIEIVGVYYSPNYQEDEAIERALWRVP